MTNILCIHKHKLHFAKYRRGGNLERVEKMKDLGVTVDEKLKFYDHIHEKVN